MKFTAEPLKTEYLIVHPERGYIKRLLQVHSDGQFDIVNQLFIRLDNIIENPLKIDINSDEWSMNINGRMGIVFGTEFAYRVFMDELLFIVEEKTKISEEDRQSSSDKVINDIGKATQYLEVKYGNEFDDSEVGEEQGD